MTLIEALVIALVSATIFGGAWTIGASFVSVNRARNGQAQITNLPMNTMSDLLNDALAHRAEDQGKIEILIGVISRAASRLRTASGMHAAAHAKSGINCPYFEQYQSAVELTAIFLEQAIEPEKPVK
jgi:hypothetical protein